MEKKLKKLFDYQRFEQNPRLSRMISEAEGRPKRLSLTDSELELVTAAGEMRPEGFPPEM